MDNEALDAPVYNSMLANTNLNDQQPFQEPINGDYTSLPCEAFSMASRTNSNSITNADEFSHKNPMYQSAHVQVKSKPIVNSDEPYNNVDNSEEGKVKSRKTKEKISSPPPNPLTCPSSKNSHSKERKKTYPHISYMRMHS